MNIKIAAILIIIFNAVSTYADVRLPSVLGDHMILQQQADVSLWGWAYEGEKVIIETSWGVKLQTVADAHGEWSVKVRTPKARPLDQGLQREEITFIVPNENMVQIKDILIGELWLTSGQSNMTIMLGPDYPAGNNGWYGDKFWKEESARTDHPAIRVFNVEKTAQALPQNDCKGVLPDHITLPKNAQGLTPNLGTGWQVCTSETAPYISAVSYYFAVRLQEKLNVPVGLVTSSVGGSPIEAWIRLEALRSLTSYAQATNKVHRNGPAALYNGMIAPLTPMTIRGILWFQGESNAGKSATDYHALLKTLITDWRERFQIKDLPFGIVQLTSYGKPSLPGESNVAVVRKAQADVASEVVNVGLAVTIDLGALQIHTPNKRDVGNRLTLWARATVYGEQNIVYQSPRYKSLTLEDGAIRVRFDTNGSALMVGKMNDKDVVQETPKEKLKWFEIAGADGKYFPADGAIEGNSVVVSSPEVPNPKAVRYAWATYPDGCNLYNKAGLPASPFRTEPPALPN